MQGGKGGKMRPALRELAHWAAQPDNALGAFTQLVVDRVPPRSAGLEAVRVCVCVCPSPCVPFLIIKATRVVTKLGGMEVQCPILWPAPGRLPRKGGLLAESQG